MKKNIVAGTTGAYEKELKKHFGDFVNKYGMTDMYTGCFADFETNEERWAYWSRWAWSFNSPGVIKFPFWNMAA